MRHISPESITDTVVAAIRHITYHPDPLLSSLLKQIRQEETSETVQDVLDTILENHYLSPELHIFLCQDTGTTVVFADLGCEVRLTEALEKSINRALHIAQRDLPLRASMVNEPLFERQNSGDNSPALIHISHTEGDALKLYISQKGGGAENNSFLKMFTPTASPDEIADYVAEQVILAGSRPCPPLILGIGIGGNFETAPLLAKRAIFQPLGRAHPNPRYHHLECDILRRINSRGCGVQGFGGNNTVLAVHIIESPCHIASLPVAVNVECHAHRHISVEVSRETN